MGNPKGVIEMAGILDIFGTGGKGPLGMGILPLIMARIRSITHPTPPGPGIVSSVMQTSNAVLKGGQTYTYPAVNAVGGTSVYLITSLLAFSSPITDNAGNVYKQMKQEILPNALGLFLYVADNITVPSSGKLILSHTISSEVTYHGLIFAILVLSNTSSPSLDAITPDSLIIGPPIPAGTPLGQGSTASASVSTSEPNDLVLFIAATQGTTPAIGSGATLVDSVTVSGVTISIASKIDPSPGTATISATVQNPSTNGPLKGYWEAQCISIKSATKGY